MCHQIVLYFSDKIMTRKNITVFMSFFNRKKWNIFNTNVSESQLSFTYRIDAYKAPLLIKPPVQQNLNKPPLFWTKSPLFEAF